MSAVIENEPVNHMEVRRIANAARKAKWLDGVKAEAEAAQKPLSRSPKKRALLALLQEHYKDYQPVVEMCHKAMRLSKIADGRTSDAIAQMDAVNAHEKVARYVTPQLKAVDLTSAGEQIQFGFAMNLAVLTK